MPLSDEQRLAQWLSVSHHVVAFTGAGISTESGIPDFRSPGGCLVEIAAGVLRRVPDVVAS